MAPDLTFDCAQPTLDALQQIPFRLGRGGRESDEHREVCARDRIRESRLDGAQSECGLREIRGSACLALADSGLPGEASGGRTGIGSLRFLAAALICVLAAAGCALDPHIDDLGVKREADTGIAPGERVAILLSSYDREGVALAGAAARTGESRQWEQIEGRLESCLKQSMLAGRSDLAFISPSELRRTLFPGKAINEFPHDPAEMLRWAGERESKERLASLGLRYVVLLNGRWSTDDEGFEIGKIPPIGGVFMYGWKRFSTLRATVLDLAHRRNAGEVVVSGKGEVLGAVAIVLVVPVPFFVMTDPENEACTALGKGLARFIAD